MKGGVISFKSRRQLHRRLLTVDVDVESNRRQTFGNRNERRRQTLHSDQMNKNIYTSRQLRRAATFQCLSGLGSGLRWEIQDLGVAIRDNCRQYLSIVTRYMSSLSLFILPQTASSLAHEPPPGTVAACLPLSPLRISDCALRHQTDRPITRLISDSLSCHWDFYNRGDKVAN